MSATTELLDKFKKAKSLATDMAAADYLGIGRAAVSAWRTVGKQAGAGSIARMCDATGEDAGAWLARVESERAKSQEDRKVWATLAKRLGTAAAILLTILPFRADAYFSAISDAAAGNLNGSRPFIHYAQLIRLLRRMFTGSRNLSPAA